MATGGEELPETEHTFAKLEENIDRLECEQVSDDLSAMERNGFSKENFWRNFKAATELISHEASKFYMMFHNPPFPPEDECQQLSDNIESTCFSFIAVFFTLPKSRGKLLHHDIRCYIISVLEAMKDLCVAARNRSAPRLQPSGNVWEKCDAVDNLPKDNRDALVLLCTEEYDLVQSKCQELMDNMANKNYSVLRVNGVSERKIFWTDSDRNVLLPCSGLIKAAKACLKKTLEAVTERGNGDDDRCINELDDVADVVKICSNSIVNGFVSSLYPPMNHTAVKDQAFIVRNTCKTLLSCVKSTHFCTNADEEWLICLEKAVNHNWLRISDFALVD